MSEAGAATAGPRDEAAATRFKDEGNAAFAAKHFSTAIDLYTKGIEACPSAVLYANRAFAHLKLENFGSAIDDATMAIELDADYPKAFYRRGSAQFGLGKYKLALADFKAVAKMHPKSRDAREKLEECKKAIRRIAFEEAIASERTVPVSQTIDLDSIVVDESYDGPHIGEVVTMDFVRAMMERFKAQKRIHKKYALRLLLEFRNILASLPTLLSISIPPENDAGEGGHVTVCGDTHGQFYDLMHIFEMNGEPSESNPYLFNGDFVDRGSFSAENVLTLIGFKVACPTSVHMLRGNHESKNMNKVYGFEGEIKYKFDERTMELFAEVFNLLPLAAVIDNKIFVVHGGLPSADGVSLDDIAAVNRNREPPDSGIMCDMLWSDPQPFAGRGRSKRGVGLNFGPDITKAFLQQNGLELLVRSHEVKEEGYLVEHDGKCITVFSAPNYCDQMGNKGAMVKFNRDLKPFFIQFEAAPHPPVKPMAYAPNLGMFGLGM